VPSGTVGSVGALEAWKRKSLPVIAHFPGCSYRKGDLDREEKKETQKNREKEQTRKRKKE